jgi:glycosyltransferase involved in cell wall biosynthesis
MKILLSACAAAPAHGSEAYFGWSAFEALSRHHDVRVITSEWSERLIINKIGKTDAARHFRFVGPPVRPIANRMLAKMESWRLNYLFHHNVDRAARAWMVAEKFDLVHHVTYSTWRVASPLWQLPIPFFWGPIGGGEKMPLSFLGTVSLQAKMFEICRILSEQLSYRDPRVKLCAMKACAVMASNVETEKVLLRLGTVADKISIICPAHFSIQKIRKIQSMGPAKKSTGILKIFSGGSLEGRKGVSLSLQALARAKMAGLEFSYVIGGGGPEARALKLLALKLNLSKEIHFHNGFNGQEYFEKLQESHIFLLPSLRESAGLTLIEAMLCGALPIVANCGGPGDIVDSDVGFKVPARNPAEVIHKIAEILLRLDRDRELLHTMGQKAKKRAETKFLSENWLKQIELTYAKGFARFSCSVRKRR